MSSKPDETGEAEQSASPFVVHVVADRYSVVASCGILVHGATYEAAAAALAEAGADPSILDTPSPPVVFHSVFAAAVASELSQLALAVDALPPDVQDIRERLDSITAHQADLQGQLDAERKRTAIRDEIAFHQADLVRRFPLVKAALGTNATDAETHACLAMTPIAARIRELRSQL